MGKIIIAELNIDSSALLKSAADNKKALDEMKKSLKDLKDENGNVTSAYVEQEVAIKKLSAEYNSQKTVLGALTDANQKLQKTEEAITAALAKEVKGTGEAKKNISELVKLRDQLDLTTTEGAKAQEAINNKIDENNKFLKENVSATEKQKLSIGDYKNQITEALNETGLFTGGLKSMGGEAGNIVNVFTSFSPVFNTLNQQFQTIIGSFGNATAAATANTAANEGAAESTLLLGTAQKAMAVGTNIATAAVRIFTLALAATGITLIIGAVVLLIGYFKQFDPIMDKLEQAFAGVSGVLTFLQETVGEFVTSISSLGDLMTKLGDIIADPIGSLEKLGNGMKTAAIAAAELKARQQDLADQQDIASIKNKQEESEIKRLMIQAKDRSKSATEQAALLEKAEAINRQIFERNKKNADEEYAIALKGAENAKKLTADELNRLQTEGIAYANFLLNKGRLRTEDYENLKKSMEAQIDIENQASEQLDKIVTKQNAAKEKAEAQAEKAREQREKDAKKREEEAQKAFDDAVKLQKAELDLFLSGQSIRAKGMREQIDLAKEVLKQKLEIAQAEFDAAKNNAKSDADRLVAQKAFQTAQNAANNEFLKTSTEATLENAKIELDLFMANNQRIIDEKKFLSDELVAIELDRLNRVSEAQAAYETQRLNDGVITEQEYRLAIKAIDDQFDADKEAVLAEKKEADIAQKALDLENKIAAEGEAFEVDLGLQMQRYEQQYAQEKAAAIKAGANMLDFEKAQAKKKADIERAVQDNKLTLASNAFGQLAELAGKESEAGKALAIAQITIDTYKSATAAYASLAGITVVGPVLGAIAAAAAVAAGLANVKKVMSTPKPNIPKAERGAIFKAIGGKRHSAGGTKFTGEDGTQFEAEAGEGIGILNRGAFAAFNEFNRQFAGGKKSSPGFHEAGGIITQGVAPEGIDGNLIVANTVAAIQAMPPIVADIKEILSVGDRVITIEEGANH